MARWLEGEGAHDGEKRAWEEELGLEIQTWLAMDEEAEPTMLSRRIRTSLRWLL
jgi:hypothetical protein